MDLLSICVVFSSFSFLGYAISYFFKPYMKLEFKRFGLEKYGLTIILLEIIGALGLLVGLQINLLLVLSSLGLALLMLAGIVVRIMIRDNLTVTLPAIFFFVLNIYIGYCSIHFSSTF